MEVPYGTSFEIGGSVYWLISIGVVGGFQLRAQGQAGAPAQASAPPAPADTAAMRANYERWRTEFKTWGKWGSDDNKGTSNLITPQKVMNAVRLVKSAPSRCLPSGVLVPRVSPLYRTSKYVILISSCRFRSSGRPGRFPPTSS